MSDYEQLWNSPKMNLVRLYGASHVMLKQVKGNPIVKCERKGKYCTVNCAVKLLLWKISRQFLENPQMNRSMHKQHISMPFWPPRMHFGIHALADFPGHTLLWKYLLFCTACHPLKFMGPRFPNAFSRADSVWLDPKITAGPLIASFFLTDFPELPYYFTTLLPLSRDGAHVLPALCCRCSFLLCAGSISLLCGASEECILEVLCIFYIPKQKILLSALIVLVYYDSALWNNTYAGWCSRLELPRDGWWWQFLGTACNFCWRWECNLTQSRVCQVIHFWRAVHTGFVLLRYLKKNLLCVHVPHADAFFI